jgi:hypothetical protein
VPQHRDSTHCWIRSFLNVRRRCPSRSRCRRSYLLDFQSSVPVTTLPAIRSVLDDFFGISLCHAGKLSLWIGYITRFEADAIVNLCNEEMLGCFSPMHPDVCVAPAEVRHGSDNEAPGVLRTDGDHQSESDLSRSGRKRSVAKFML